MFHKITSTRFTKYISIGLFTTFLTFLCWNILIYVFGLFTNLEDALKISITQFLASILLIYPSFYLNKKITFRDKDQKDKKNLTILFKVYLIYIASPVLASIFTFILQSLYDFESVNIIINSTISVKLGRFALQFIGLLLGAVLNFNGQKLWLYHP